MTESTRAASSSTSSAVGHHSPAQAERAASSRSAQSDAAAKTIEASKQGGVVNPGELAKDIGKVYAQDAEQGAALHASVNEQLSPRDQASLDEQLSATGNTSTATLLNADSMESTGAGSLSAQATPNPQPGPSRPDISDIPGSTSYEVKQHRDQINAAAQRYGVAPEVIGGIMYDELTHRGFEDDAQDKLAERVAATLPGTPERAKALGDANNHWSVNPGAILGKKSKDIASNVTVGTTQLSVNGVKVLVNSENGKNYLEKIISRDSFNKDPVGNSLKLLSDDKMAPFLIGAWAKKQVDTRSGEKRDGITYPKFGKDDNRDLHYVFLTGTYSKGGYFKNDKGGIDKERTADPLKYTDLSKLTGPNESATDGLRARKLINTLLQP
jgi:hypothetical protein